MTNYDLDEIERQREREKKSRGIRSEDEMKNRVEVEDEDFLKIAQEAHARDITFNKMINIILKTGLKDAEYRFEHDPKPLLLNETE